MKGGSREKRRHVVAWINKPEWDQVLEHLYSQDPGLQRFGLQRVSAWRSRFAHSSPVAVDCTADLVRCQVLDRSGQLDADELVLLYGAALVRFVNLITERQQGRRARPLRRLAGKLNIPEWLVDLRHDFTHKKLPTLTWCRKGCKVVLEWLQQEYWSRQLGGPAEDWGSDSDGDAEDEDAELSLQSRQKKMEAHKAARDLLVAYENERYQNLERLQEDKCPSPLADMSWLLGEIQQLCLDSSELLADVLLEDGFLVPTAEQLRTLGCGPAEDPSEPRLPQALLRFWLPLLKMLASPAFVRLLLEKLLAELRLLGEKQNHLRGFYLAAWLSELVLCNSNKFEFRFERKTQRKARTKERLFTNRLQLPWQQLLVACLEAPGPWTPHLLRVILDDMEHPPPQDTQQKLLRLCCIYTQTSVAEPGLSREHLPIFTLESLHLKQLRLASGPSGGLDWDDVLTERAKALRGSPWQLSSDKVSWKNYPLGKVPGQSDDPSCLMAETYSQMAVSEQPVELEGGARQSIPAVSGPSRAREGLLWNQADVSRLKSGLRLF